MADDQGSERRPELQVEQDDELLRRGWRIERIGWGVLLLVVVAGAAGLFGSGPLARENRSAAGKLAIGYDRFGRVHAETTTLEISLRPDAAGRTACWVSRSFLDAYDIRRIDPEPESSVAEPDRTLFTFAAGGSGEPVTVSFHLEPDLVGRHAGRIGMSDGSSLAISQLVYP